MHTATQQQCYQLKGGQRARAGRPRARGCGRNPPLPMLGCEATRRGGCCVAVLRWDVQPTTLAVGRVAPRPPDATSASQKTYTGTSDQHINIRANHQPVPGTAHGDSLGKHKYTRAQRYVRRQRSRGRSGTLPDPAPGPRGEGGHRKRVRRAKGTGKGNKRCRRVCTLCT